jgi:DNA-binding CsgD family transcriptional regulator
MTQSPRLSDRERDVLQQLLQGKSNKLIAASLDISVRTVEFHLKNIYTKAQVSSRIELILKLVNATGQFETERLGCSTVDRMGESIENRDRFNSRMGWATAFREIVSMIGKELEMKNVLRSKQVLAGVITALLTGSVWVSALLASHTLSFNEIQLWIVPLVVIWAAIGLSIGLVGKHTGNSSGKVFVSTWVGTGLSPFAIIPLMFIIVLPLGKLAERLGFIDPATMSSDLAATLTMTAMTGLWLVVGIIFGIVMLFVTLKKLEQTVMQVQGLEQGL